ncbi:intein/intein [Geodermatophilus normandii]|uniref:Intein/intein n=1 Tax=Geodermatophilus normandii TaxID=1137989 RepID=A0A317QN93_9ACTN|nr:intein-containing Rv2578c family radical SAM protein [Geodermatophilus normandii]PWW24307.1 intein/intein [Geodermatophilus normandii]
MRWDARRLDADDESLLPGMPSLRGLLRSVEVPEFPGVTMHEVLCRSALNPVPEASRMPFSHTINPYRGCLHQCVYCLAGDTRILMADGRQRPIAALRVGDRVIGTERRGTHRYYVETEVLAHWGTVKPAHRVTLADGTELLASGDHRFLTRRGWRHVTGTTSGRGRRPHLTTDDELMGFGRTGTSPVVRAEYRRGHLAGTVRGDGHLGVHRQERPGRAHGDDHRFGLALVDDEGPDRAQAYLAAEGIRTPRLGVADAVGNRRPLPAIRTSAAAAVGRIADRRECGVDGIAVEADAALQVVDLQSVGLEMPMFDITTGTGDFVANGVVSHNCFARSTHEWLDLDAGRDFDTQIVVKTNLVEVLRRELARPSGRRRHVALGTNTDPYQRAEGRYRLMPGVIRALADSGTPFSVLTKGTLARRDLPLLADAARDVPVGFGVSLAIWDDDLHASLEPGVPSPRARLDLVRAVADAGLPCGVFLAPVLPGLTDRRSDLDAALGAIAEAGATGVTVVPLHLRPGAREWFSAWLAREHPSLVGRYRQLYRGGAYVPAEYRAWLAARVAPLLRRHGLDGRSDGAARGAEAPPGVPGDDEAAFPAGSLPPARDDAAARPRGARPRRARADDVPGQLALI